MHTAEQEAKCSCTYVQLWFWRPWKGWLMTDFILFLVIFDMYFYELLGGYFNVLVGFHSCL